MLHDNTAGNVVVFSCRAISVCFTPVEFLRALHVLVGAEKTWPPIPEDTETSLFLAACDDAGKARWTEAKPLSPPESQTDSPATKGDNYDKDASSTILHHDLHGVAVVPACAFRPASISGLKRGGGSGGPSLELATGGTDCKIHLWDIFRPKYVLYA